MIKNRKWNVGDRDTDREAAEKIAAALGIEYITAKLLCARGYRTPEEANSFIRLSGTSKKRSGLFSRSSRVRLVLPCIFF